MGVQGPTNYSSITGGSSEFGGPSTIHPSLVGSSSVAVESPHRWRAHGHTVRSIFVQQPCDAVRSHRRSRDNADRLHSLASAAPPSPRTVSADVVTAKGLRAIHAIAPPLHAARAATAINAVCAVRATVAILDGTIHVIKKIDLSWSDHAEAT